MPRKSIRFAILTLALASAAPMGNAFAQTQRPPNTNVRAPNPTDNIRLDVTITSVTDSPTNAEFGDIFRVNWSVSAGDRITINGFTVQMVEVTYSDGFVATSGGTYSAPASARTREADVGFSATSRPAADARPVSYKAKVTTNFTNQLLRRPGSKETFKEGNF